VSFAQFLSDWSAEMREDNDRAERVAHAQAKLEEIDGKLAAMREAGEDVFPGWPTCTTPLYSRLLYLRVRWLAALMEARHEN
jgi:hypothetical protein